MSEHRRPTEERRAELVDAALHIIATRGITALSTRTLAGHVGLTSGALFRHFPTLDALLVGVVDRVEAVLDATYPPAGLPPVERLDRFVEARSTAVGERLGILRLLQSEQFRLALPADGSDRLARCVGRTRRFLGECLREGQATGVFRSDLPAEALTMIVVGTVQALAQAGGPPASGVPSGFDHAEIRRALITLLQPPHGGNRT
jgi:TetR/AcrR family transcriptional regulator